jgi:hypothetical protein
MEDDDDDDYEDDRGDGKLAIIIYDVDKNI